ncbi:alpha/beta hydrolase [Actinocorallia populi]|uniref:alpha/beta hydrolase n=1 Tax=Actinocorallia populi TaxID=2079200 RepID=UPI001E655DF1|nr:alpha/beta hydrolase [Actinocorallia populi]
MFDLSGETPAARLAPRRLDWHRCRTGPDDLAGRELDAAGAACAELEVPLDHRRPAGRRIEIAVTRLKATGQRRGTLFYNPGGPGIPVIPLMLHLAKAVPAVAARYDLVGMDPRFVGRSTPLNCGWPTVSIGAAGPSRRTFDRTVATARELASRCAPHRAVLPHASTRETARDMDAVRAALGVRKISYLGSSYGTYLGQVYVRMFPRRVDRVVLDSALDPRRYGPDLTRTQGPAVAAALRRWASWTARRDGRFHLGSTTARVLRTVDRLNTSVGREPVRVGRHRVDGRILPQLLWNVTAGDDAGTYASFAADVRVLWRASRGARVGPTPVLEQTLSGLAAADTDGTFSVQTAILCADRAVPRDPEVYYRDLQKHRAKEPVFGPLTRAITPCSFWPARPAERPTRVRGGVPLLMVGAAGDPAATYKGQLAAHRALAGSRLVTLRGAFRHTVYAGLFAPQNACIDRTVNRYLLKGVLPARDTACRTS